MKNIMLIAITTLTIATANADGYNWKPSSAVQVVNNTNVTLEFRTEPGNDYLEVPANTTKYGVNAGSYGTYIGWGINQNSNIPPVWNDSFDYPEATIGGTMSATTSNFQGDIWPGQVWAVGGIGYNDTLTIDGWPQPSGAMYISITRTRGPVVYRTDDSWTNSLDAWVFCGGNTMALGVVSSQGSTRCPAYETQVLMAATNLIHPWIDSGLWSWDRIVYNIYQTCDFTSQTCKDNPNVDWHGVIYGQYITGFSTAKYVPGSVTQLNIKLVDQNH